MSKMYKRHKNSCFFAFLPKNVFLPKQKCQNIILKVFWASDHYIRLKVWWLVKIQKQLFFWSWPTSYALGPLKEAPYLYIFPCFLIEAFLVQNNKKLHKFFILVKVPHLLSNIYFEAQQAIKTRWDTLIWKKTHKNGPVFAIFVRQLTFLHDIYFERW